MVISFNELRFACRTEYVLNLMGNHVLDCLAGRFKILTRIEVVRMFGHVLTDRCCHSESDIRVDVDFAYGQFSCMAKFCFRNADGIRHVASVLVNDFYKFLRNR